MWNQCLPYSVYLLEYLLEFFKALETGDHVDVVLLQIIQVLNPVSPVRRVQSPCTPERRVQFLRALLEKLFKRLHLALLHCDFLARLEAFVVDMDAHVHGSWILGDVVGLGSLASPVRTTFTLTHVPVWQRIVGFVFCRHFKFCSLTTRGCYKVSLCRSRVTCNF